MLKELLKPEIKELIEQRFWTDLKDILQSWPAPEIVELLLDIDDKTDRVFLFRALPREISAEVFSYLEYEQRDNLLYDLTDQETRQLLEDLPPDDRTALLEELPGQVTRRLLNLLNPEDLREARTLLGYPEDSIGRLMTPDFVAVRPEWTVRQALTHIRKFGKHSETVNRIYVTDKTAKLLDDVLLRNIILADESETISNLMDFNVVSVSAFDDQEQAVATMEKYDIAAIPVVDSMGQLVGIITFDDIFDIQEEEATEDFQKISGINPMDQSYLSASIWKLWVKRFPWLLILLFTNFITAGVISHYRFVLESVVILASFMPLLTGTAGNSGTQSATLIIRSIATGDVHFKDWFKVLRKELIVGLMLGGALAILTYARTLVETAPAGSENLPWVISLSMVILVLWSNMIGSLLPIVLSKLKLDPAVISSPFIATFTDVTGMLIYFNIAIWLLDLPK